MKRRLPKTCERCHRTFVCGLFGCWCRELPITDQQYVEITERYHDCLCPSCLAEWSGKPLNADLLKLSSPASES
ncbi:MAG: cysteine-rich CWC family protein [Nitrospira sp.]|nr:cysteine-rich CWC family protein [Nitrospira sp.]